MITFLTSGVVLGLSAGFAPGPLLALVISETLQHGVRSGIKVAIAPFLTDLPIIILIMFALPRFSNLQPLLGVISVLGGLFLFYLGYESIRIKGVVLDLHGCEPKSFRKGIMVNALSPYPYLFWFSVGMPILYRASEQSTVAALGFVGSFYLLLVGSKVVLALLVGKSTTFLSGRGYIYTMRFLGGLLIVFGLILFRDGIKLSGLL